MWTPRGTWSAQEALSPPPPWPKQEREAPGKDNISNIPAAMLHEVHMEGLFCLLPLSSSKGTTAVVAHVLGRIATLRLPPLRARSQGTRYSLNGRTQLLCPTEPLALKCPHRVTTPSKRLVHNNEGTAQSPLASLESSDTAVYIVITYAKHCLRGHGAGLAAVEISASSRSDG